MSNFLLFAEPRIKHSLVLVTIVVFAFISMGCDSSWGTKQDTAAPQNYSSGPVGGDQSQSQGQVELTHVHGMGFTADGRQLMVAAHDGLRIFADGRWQAPNLAAHDYMGFITTNDGFYSSGHPDPATNMVNPFGLIKSNDGGKTLTRLGFEGESDFHLMGVGYQNHAIYVLNSEPNSRLSQPGLYYSLDDGQTWQHSAMQSMAAAPIQIAVHPTEANVVVMATEIGLFLSNDYGATFEQIAESGPASAAMFISNGDALIFGYQGLFVFDLVNKQIIELSAPPLAPGDAIAYMAVSPTRIEDVAVSTFQRDFFISRDGGYSWGQIARAGVGVILH